MKDLLTCASGLFPVDRPDWIHGDAAEWQLFQNSRDQLQRADMRPYRHRRVARERRGAYQGISRFSRIVAVT